MEKVELIRKIKALASGGVGGERENAQILLEKLMKKFDISEEQICDEKILEFKFKLPKIYNGLALAVQVMASIVGNFKNKGIFRQGRKCYALCTSGEFLEFQAKLNFYAYYYKIELKRFYRAFVQANKIFPKDSGASTPKELTNEDYMMLNLARSLRKHDYNLQIEEGV